MPFSIVFTVVVCLLMFFNRGSAEPQGSTSGFHGFRKNKPKLPGNGNGLLSIRVQRIYAPITDPSPSSHP